MRDFTDDKPAPVSTADPTPAEVRDGSGAAFDRLYGRYAPQVMGYLLRLTGSRSDAEDLTQETFLAGFKGRETYQGRSRPLAWLLGIAARRWRDKRRTPCPTMVEISETQADLGRGPEEKAVARIALDAALDRLEPVFREPLLLVASQGLTYVEAAAVLEEPVGTVKWRVHEATRRMRVLLADCEDDIVKERNDAA